MSTFNEDILEKRLLALKDTQESISTLSAWCLEHPGQHKKIVSIWLQVLKRVKIEQRLTLFHLANDVIQYSKRKGFDFVESWGTALQKATTMVRDDKVKNKILRLFKIWDERSIYDEAFLVDLSGLLSSRKPAQSNQDAQDFQPATLISKIRSCKNLEDDTDLKRKIVNESDLALNDADALHSSLKDRRHGADLDKELEEGVEKMKAFISALQAEIKDRTALIEMLDLSDAFYENQRGEAKIVCNAYRNFSKRVENLKKKLDEITDSLPSPVPSPDVNAPSPSPESDIDLPDDENMGGSYSTASSFIGSLVVPEHAQLYNSSKEMYSIPSSPKDSPPRKMGYKPPTPPRSFKRKSSPKVYRSPPPTAYLTSLTPTLSSSSASNYSSSSPYQPVSKPSPFTPNTATYSIPSVTYSHSGNTTYEPTETYPSPTEPYSNLYNPEDNEQMNSFSDSPSPDDSYHIPGTNPPPPVNYINIPPVPDLYASMGRNPSPQGNVYSVSSPSSTEYHVSSAPYSKSRKCSETRSYSEDKVDNYLESRSYGEDKVDNYSETRSYGEDKVDNYPETRSYNEDKVDNYPLTRSYSEDKVDNYPMTRSYSEDKVDNYTETRSYSEDKVDHYPETRSYSEVKVDNYTEPPAIPTSGYSVPPHTVNDYNPSLRPFYSSSSNLTMPPLLGEDCPPSAVNGLDSFLQGENSIIEEPPNNPPLLASSFSSFMGNLNLPFDFQKGLFSEASCDTPASPARDPAMDDSTSQLDTYFSDSNNDVEGKPIEVINRTKQPDLSEILKAISMHGLGVSSAVDLQPPSPVAPPPPVPPPTVDDVYPDEPTEEHDKPWSQPPLLPPKFPTWAQEDWIETPASPPLYEKTGFGEPVEFEEPDSLVLGETDTDLRSLGLQGDIDHRNLISLTSSPRDEVPWSSNQDTDYRKQALVPKRGTQDDNVESVDMEMSDEEDIEMEVSKPSVSFPLLPSIKPLTESPLKEKEETQVKNLLSAPISPPPRLPEPPPLPDVDEIFPDIDSSGESEEINTKIPSPPIPPPPPMPIQPIQPIHPIQPIQSIHSIQSMHVHNVQQFNPVFPPVPRPRGFFNPRFNNQRQRFGPWQNNTNNHNNMRQRPPLPGPNNMRQRPPLPGPNNNMRQRPPLSGPRFRPDNNFRGRQPWFRGNPRPPRYPGW